MDLPPELIAEETAQQKQGEQQGQTANAQRADVQTAQAIPLRLNPTLTGPAPGVHNIAHVDAAIDQFVVKRQNGEQVPADHFTGLAKTPVNSLVSSSVNITRLPQNTETPVITPVTARIAECERSEMRSPMQRMDTPRPNADSTSIPRNEIDMEVEDAVVPKTLDSNKLKNTVRKQLFSETEAVEQQSIALNNQTRTSTQEVITENPQRSCTQTAIAQPTLQSTPIQVTGTVTNQLGTQSVSGHPTPVPQQTAPTQSTPTQVPTTVTNQPGTQSLSVHPTPVAQQTTPTQSTTSQVPITVPFQTGVKRSRDEIDDSASDVSQGSSVTPKKKKIVYPKNLRYTIDGEPLPAYYRGGKQQFIYNKDNKLVPYVKPP